MKRGLENIILSLLFLQLNCSMLKESERSNITPDRNNIYKLAFPENCTKLNYIKIDDKKLLIEFDSGHDNIKDFAVIYYLKYFNSNDDYEIDEDKVPETIIKDIKENGVGDYYFFNKEKRSYEYKFTAGFRAIL